MHGAFAALEQAAILLDNEDSSKEAIFLALTTVRPAALVSPQSSEILQTACDLMSAVLDERILRLEAAQAVLDRYIDMTMKRKEEGCHEAVARLYGRLSSLRDCTPETKKCGLF